MPAVLPGSLEVLEVHEIPAEFNEQAVRAFIDEAKRSAGAELANTQRMFVNLCKALQVPEPRYKRANSINDYCFEEDVKEANEARRMDVYYLGHFVFEAKQGIDSIEGKSSASERLGRTRSTRGAGVRGSAEWQRTLRAARIQAGNYAVWATRRGDPKPPFLIVADMGYRFWVWSSFQADPRDDYGDFDPSADAAFSWDDLAKPQVFVFLRAIFTAPDELNEEVLGQRVTALIAEKICTLAVRLEARAEPERVSDFLMQCIFTMFAEDARLIPHGLFRRRLEGWIKDLRTGKPGTFVRGLRRLWATMRDGGDLESGDRLPRFNGYLFRTLEPLDLDLDEIQLLLEAARANWRKVSPAIFGTLLEQALSVRERKTLGAHYTPEAHIRRLVEKTIIEPLRDEWSRVRIEMDLIRSTGTGVKQDGSVVNARRRRKDFDAVSANLRAIEHGHSFRRRLAGIKVLDPACGSGNFLYVALKEMKRLEGEVERALLAVEQSQSWLDIDGETVRPVQFWGIEVKPWAAKVAELVLWIGYLQWQTSAGRLPRMREPLIQDLHHIKNEDALIAWTGKKMQVDQDGRTVLRAVGVTERRARRKIVPVEEYVDATQTAWPEADYIVGNPPFLGNKRLRDVLGAGYVDAIKGAYPEISGSADLVMWWWWRSADLVAQGKVKRFGLVTTNSITQAFNRAIVSRALSTKICLAYAIADHPWYDEGAAVRIAMTVGARGGTDSTLGLVVDETTTNLGELDKIKIEESRVERIHADLTAGADVAGARPLVANQGICYQGMNLVGEGFRLTPEELRQLGYRASRLPAVVHPYLIARDLVQGRPERYVIDFYGLEPETARTRYPALWDRIVTLVKPARDKNNRASRRENWWLFGEPVGKLRSALTGLARYIATPETAKHRLFQFLDVRIIPDHTIYAIASDDAFVLGVLSSNIHQVWSLNSGGTLEDRPRWNNTLCFVKFPFPEGTKTQRASVARHAEAIEEHRRKIQSLHADLTLTSIYNVLEKLRTGASLTSGEQSVVVRGAVRTLGELHEHLDRAVSSAYGWPADLSGEEILARLVDLNATRVHDESVGLIRSLRPDIRQTQAPQVQSPVAEKPARSRKKVVVSQWPSGVFERVGAALRALRSRERATSAEELAAEFNTTPEEIVLALRNAAAAQLAASVVTEDGEKWIARG